MLIQFTAKNVYSFRDETAFNLFPNKTHSLPHHKVSVGGVEFLRMSALYGANAAGKSNLIKAIALLKSLVAKGKLGNESKRAGFRLAQEPLGPSMMSIEFAHKGKLYYYALSFEGGIVVYEYLAESKKDADILVFERSNEGAQQIRVADEYQQSPKAQLFIEVLAEKILEKDELLLSLFSGKYPDDFPQARDACGWFDQQLQIVTPNDSPDNLAHLIDTDSKLNEFANSLVAGLDTGIQKLSVEKHILSDSPETESSKAKLIGYLKNSPNNMMSIGHRSFICENDDVCVKVIMGKHTASEGKQIAFEWDDESDGTQRLLEYLPFLYEILHSPCVYLVDEIERSIHPMLIKQLIAKLSHDQQLAGQLIFTTHESCLLDQSILRPDEIWFAQKDAEGASKLYSLSDFQIHNTANVENGYLNGRFGAIPFLSNLKDLNWHCDAEAQQE